MTSKNESSPMRIGNAAVLFCIIITALVVGGCGTTKNFALDSNPQGAMITAQSVNGLPTVDGKMIFKDTPIGTTPLKSTIWFSDETKVNLIAEKRGYTSSTIAVDKNSAESQTFNLQKIDGVPQSTFRKEDLLTGTFAILPSFIEVHIHSGVGRLDKIELSQEESKKVTENFNKEFVQSLNPGNGPLKWCELDETMKNAWPALCPQVNKYILKLDSKRLPNYSLPPYISEQVADFKPFTEKLQSRPGGENKYLIYIWGKCVTETTGRQIGNILLSFAGATMKGIQPGFWYDPTAFNPDSGTLLNIYVIDAKTSEVLYIDQRVYADITDNDTLKKVAAAISKFPATEKKE